MQSNRALSKGNGLVLLDCRQNRVPRKPRTNISVLCKVVQVLRGVAS